MTNTSTGTLINSTNNTFSNNTSTNNNSANNVSSTILNSSSILNTVSAGPTVI